LLLSPEVRADGRRTLYEEGRSHIYVIIFILVMEAVRSAEASVLKRATRRHIQEDGILHNHHSGNLKSRKT
jgi:hypothetical protein